MTNRQIKLLQEIYLELKAVSGFLHPNLRCEKLDEFKTIIKEQIELNKECEIKTNFIS